MRKALTPLFLLTCLAAVAQDEVGKVWLKSDPAGAEIFLGVKDKDGVLVPKDTGKKTNALIELLAGKQTLVLHLEGYENATVEVSANPAAIAKPETVVLSKPMKPVDILFAEDGWIIFVDDKGGDATESARDAHNQVATTPCTIKMTIGKHTVDLHKAGFLKISFPCEVTDKTTSIEVKGKIEKSGLAKKTATETGKDIPSPEFLGSYFRGTKADAANTLTLLPDGKLDYIGDSDPGNYWKVGKEKDEIVIFWNRWNKTEIYKFDRRTNTLVGTDAKWKKIEKK